MKDLGDLNNWTKTDLARVINQALLNKDKPLPANHFRVTRMVKATSKKEMVRLAESAINIIDRIKMTKLNEG